MMIKSNDRLAHITSNHVKLYFILKLLMLTTSALLDYEYRVYRSYSYFYSLF